MAKAPPDIDKIEELEQEAVPESAEITDSEEISFDEDDELKGPPTARLAAVVAASIFAASSMAGGVFVGFMPRIWLSIAGLLGVYVGLRASRSKRPVFMYLTIVVGLFAIGLLLVIPEGFSNISGLRALVKDAAKSGNNLPPPVDFTAGWRAIAGWLMGGLGFAATWIAIEIKKPALGILIPLPITAITAISVPESDQIISGLGSLVFFAISLGLLSGANQAGEGERPSLAYEVRRSIRALPMLAGVCVALYFLAQTNFLFPDPAYNPNEEAQRPKPIPLGKVKDRVLFRVKSSATGPWRTGHLDIYESKDGTWRLPPVASTKLEKVPKSGVVDTELQPGVRATFQIADLGGAVLPGLPNTVGIVAEGPRLAYDARTGNIRLSQGTIKPDLAYTVVAASLPDVEELTQINQDVPRDVEQFIEIPDPPPAVVSLMKEAPTSSLWEKFDFMRTKLLKTVVAQGSGTPIAVQPSKVQDMLIGSKTGTPFEIVAGQAMLARWAGLPSRIAYGYDGGICQGEDRPPPCSKKDALLEVRPRHGASFLEVYFPTFKWLPVIGNPLQAKTELSSDQQQYDPNVAASNDVAVKLYIPIPLDAKGLLYAQIRRIVSIVVPLLVLLLLLYYGFPAIRKSIIKSRRRSWAAHQGTHARIALSYAEWRDLCTDYGYRYDGDTPLMFLDRVVEDDEHTELAWLVTRTLWGDLRDNVTNDDASAAEELSRALRSRLGQGHAATLRVIATVSRLSIRHPYAPNLIAAARAVRSKEKHDEVEAA